MEDLSRRKKVVLPLVDAATVTVDASKGDIFDLVTPGGAGRIIDGPTGGYNGQSILIRCKNTHGSTAITHTLDVTGTDSFRYPPGFNATQPIPAGVVGGYVAQYHAGDAKWDVRADALGDFPAATVDYSYLAAIGGYV